MTEIVIVMARVIMIMMIGKTQLMRKGFHPWHRLNKQLGYSTWGGGGLLRRHKIT